MATKVQSTTATAAAGTSATPSLTGVTAGNCLILKCSYLDVNQATAAVPATPTDSNGTFAVASAPACQSGSSVGCGSPIFFVKNCNAGTHNVTFNPHAHAGALYAEVSLEEWSGIDTAVALDKATSNGSSSAASTTTGNTGTTAALAQANELVVASLAISAGTGKANAGISTPASAGYTSLLVFQATDTAVGAEQSFKEASSTAGQIATWTWTTDASMQSWQGNIATFLETGGGGGSVMGSMRMVMP